MLVSAAQVADTLRLLLPGFVALKLFYLFGPRTKRGIGEWSLLSILATVPINLVATRFRANDDDLRFGIAVAIAVGSGAVAGMLYSVAWRRLTWVQFSSSARMWDYVMSSNQWVQVWLKNGQTFIARPESVALTSEVDDADVYLTEPHAIDEAGQTPRMEKVEGFLVARSEISDVAVFEKGKGPDEDATEPVTPRVDWDDWWNPLRWRPLAKEKRNRS
jgi:Family of unknown function (DUF6338)